MTFDADAWYGRKPLTEVGRTMVADLSLVDVGWEAWSCARRDADENALGGIVSQLRVVTAPDLETGELVETRFYRVLNPYIGARDRHFATTLIGSEIRLPDGVVAPERGLIGRLIMKLCQSIGDPHAYITRADLDHLVDAWRLAQVVAV